MFFRLLMIALVLGTVGGSATRAANLVLPPVLLQMIRDDAIHQELGMTDEQRDQVLEILPAIDAEWFRARNWKPEESTAKIASLTDQLRQRLQAILDAAQLERLEQLQRQALGTRMTMRDDVVQALGLSSQQTEKLVALYQSTDAEVVRLNQQVFDGERSGESAGEKIARAQALERKGMVDVLNDRQRSMLGSLAGSPFDFSQVKRMYPMPPELESDGVTWLRGETLDLKSLRGKVVAVHFYAFQCINCQRNLPHYTAWHKDYADQGLVIIGIQTPETSAERSLARVKAAAEMEQIEYPVMLDADKSNWDAWNNTMWPTVYLIDKEGFLRRWWQGEMNWNGTPGESQMRKTIEQLLAE